MAGDGDDEELVTLPFKFVTGERDPNLIPCSWENTDRSSCSWLVRLFENIFLRIFDYQDTSAASLGEKLTHRQISGFDARFPNQNQSVNENICLANPHTDGLRPI